MSESPPDLRSQVESYLFFNGFHTIRAREEINVHFVMRSREECYDLVVEREWLAVKTSQSIKERLDHLQVVPFLRQHRAAWVGMSASGQEILTHIETDATT
jgi:hypothetical protein